MTCGLSWIATVPGSLIKLPVYRGCAGCVEMSNHEQAKFSFEASRRRSRIETTQTHASGNLVGIVNGEIVIRRGRFSRTSPSRSLENWLRKSARTEIEKHLVTVTKRLRQKPNRLYLMGQRTKWGNCSSRRNLSFNWKLILAPEFVLHYLVTHEAVHLAIPNH